MSPTFAMAAFGAACFFLGMLAGGFTLVFLMVAFQSRFRSSAK